jgi:antitoxin VapB
MSATNSKPQDGTSAEAAPKTAKLFKNGRSQAVRLPREFAFEGAEIFIRRDPSTGEVILAPKPEPLPASWLNRFAAWDSLDLPGEEGLERDQSPPVERDFF